MTRVFLVMQEEQDKDAFPVSVHASLRGARDAAVLLGARVVREPQVDEHDTEAEWYFASDRAYGVVTITMLEMLP